MDMELVKKAFLNRYEDQWDYSHNMLEKGDIFYYYLKENGLVEKYKHLLTRDTFPKHISDVPKNLLNDYMEYLKEYLMEFWNMETWNDDSYLLEHALEEFKEQLDFEKEC